MIKWYAADKLPDRKILIFISDMRITIPATSDALARARRDAISWFSKALGLKQCIYSAGGYFNHEW